MSMENISVPKLQPGGHVSKNELFIEQEFGEEKIMSCFPTREEIGTIEGLKTENESLRQQVKDVYSENEKLRYDMQQITDKIKQTEYELAACKQNLNTNEMVLSNLDNTNKMLEKELKKASEKSERYEITLETIVEVLGKGGINEK